MEIQKRQPFQLLEINIISAQDLEPVSKKMKTYATAWVHPKRKLTTRVDADGGNDPTWNDKFVFRVDEEFLHGDTSAVMIELYAVHWFRDTLIGTVRVLVGNLIPPPSPRPHHHHRHHHHFGLRFVALQVRRPSGRPQGILNIGVAVLDSSMRSMPLYTQLSASAVGYRDLMGEDDSHHHQQQQHNNQNQQGAKPILRRSRSERSERPAFDNLSSSIVNSSIVATMPKKGNDDGSIISITDSWDPFMGKGKKGKASSVISGAELREKPKPKGKKGKASSVVSDSVVSSGRGTAGRDKGKNGKPNLIVTDLVTEKPKPGSEHNDRVIDEKFAPISNGFLEVGAPTPKPPTIGKPIAKPIGVEDGPKQGKFIFGARKKASSLLSDSEVGPSPSEVAAAMVAERKYPLEDNQSSVLDGWSLDESVEGLRSKLERWRTELPPLYDRGYSSSSFKSTSQHVRRHTDGGSGLFSCFGNIYGYECQCICGKPPARTRFHSPSIGSAGRSFL